MNKPFKRIICFIIISILILSSLSFLGCKKELDISECMSMTFEIEVDEGEKITDQITSTMFSLRSLLVKKGYENAVVSPYENKGVIVYLPKSDEARQMLLLINRPASFEVRKEGLFESEMSEPYLTEKDIQETSVVYNQNGYYEIKIQFDKEGTKKLENATRERLNKDLNIWIDGSWKMGPAVNSVITTGEIIIPSGTYQTSQDLEELATRLYVGSLGLKMVDYDFKDEA